MKTACRGCGKVQRYMVCSDACFEAWTRALRAKATEHEIRRLSEMTGHRLRGHEARERTRP